MDINATLFGQMITFGLFVLFTWRYVWPPLHSALDERQSKIADGLAAAERGHHDLKLAQEKATQVLRESRQEASGIVDDARFQAQKIVDAAKEQAQAERKKIIEKADLEVGQLYSQAKDTLRKEVSALALKGAEQILSQNIDDGAHERLLDQLVEEL